MGVLEPDPVRPRQVRYQAALRPDSTGSTDSKLLSGTAGHAQCPSLVQWSKPLFWDSLVWQTLQGRIKVGRRRGESHTARSFVVAR